MQTTISTSGTLADPNFAKDAVDRTATDLGNFLDPRPTTYGGHQAGQEAMLLQHMAMVRFVARRIHERVPQHIDLDDLISAGVVGLLDALAKFDGSKQTQFRSYAQLRVRGAILDSLRSLDWSPRELRRKGRAVGETLRALTSQLGRIPLDSEIANAMGLDLLSYQHLTGELSGLTMGSLNAERSEEVGDEELDFLEAPAGENPLAQYMREHDKQRLMAALCRLEERERLVLTLYYFEEMTMREIGLTLGVVESRVSQIRAAALAQLRLAFAGRALQKSVLPVSH